MTTRRDFDLAQHPDMIAQLENDYVAFRSLEKRVMTELGEDYAATGSLRPRECPLCGIDQPRLLFTKYGMDIVECRECGMRYSRSVMYEEFDRDHYEQDSTGTGVALDRLRRHTVYRELDLRRGSYIVECLHAHGLAAGASLLDVGPGHGALLDAAAADGLRAQGIELSPALVESCRARGLEVRRGMFPDALAADESFDAIVMLDVLEHFPSPRPALAVLRQHLPAGGLLAVQVPNMDSLQIQLDGAASANYCLGHWSHFTPSTLRRLLQENGFELLRLETYISEMHRIARHPREQVDTALRELGQHDLDAARLDADAVLARDLGYKLFAVARALP